MTCLFEDFFHHVIYEIKKTSEKKNVKVLNFDRTVPELDDDEVNPLAVQRSANFLLAKEIQAVKIKPCTRAGGKFSEEARRVCTDSDGKV